MTKPSRSKRSQPEFDPSELEDLIFTPAVGSGVGSHLLTTVDKSDQATVAIPDEPTENQGNKNMTTVGNPPTVVDQTIVVEETSVAEMSTVGAVATVVRFAPGAIWVTEEGELVPGSRVKRIRLAQDALTTAEESVYDALWTAKTAERQELDAARIVQAGYDFLMKKTRLSKKTIQRIVDRLIDKGFIAIERPADIYQRTATVYRVFGYRLVLERQAARQRFYVVKIGPGLLYAHPASNLAPVDNSTTVDKLNLSIAVAPAPVTGPREHLTTVVAPTTIKIEQTSIGNLASSSEVRLLRQRIEKLLGTVDDDALAKLLADCRARAGDCTIAEIAYFVEHKLRWVRNIQNPVGFILTAVPRHFENEGHLAVRELLRQEDEARQEEWRETHAYWSRIADDINQPEPERVEARKVLAALVNYLKS
jgi:predicted transcriptional regulator